jgi:hypothetical protein
VDSTDTAALLESEGCKLAPVIIASKKTTATPFGGVSPSDKLMGTALPAGGGVMELPPQPTNVYVVSAIAKPKKDTREMYRRMVGPPA